MNNKEIKFLKTEFQNAIDEIGEDKRCAEILQRKFAHSSRVLENGLQIINHDIPQILSQPEFKKQCEIALLFHDIGRFRETVELYKRQSMKYWGGRMCDHGILGAEILSQTPEYRDTKILLSVRHHGHLIEEFYNDAEYSALSDADKSLAEIMIKLVRDADKLDLYYLQKYYNNIESDVIFHNLTEKQKFAPLSEEVLTQFFSAKPINHTFIKTLSDRILGCISWQFDINYSLTIQLYISEGYSQKLFDLLAVYCNDKPLIDKIFEFASTNNC